MLRELVGAAPGALLRWSDPGRHAGVIWWYERAFGLIAATAFVSLGVQVDALVGEHGILPAANLFEAATEQLGWQRFVQLPSLYWCWPSDAMLFGLCGAGTLAGLATRSAQGLDQVGKGRPGLPQQLPPAGCRRWQVRWCLPAICRWSTPARYSWATSGMRCWSSAPC